MSNLGFAIDRVRDSVDDTRDNLYVSEDADAHQEEKDLLHEDDEIERLLNDPSSRRRALHSSQHKVDGKVVRRERRRASRRENEKSGDLARRRGGRDQSLELMHEMEDGANRSSTDSDGSSELYRDDLGKIAPSAVSQKTRVRRLAAVHVFIVGLFAALIYGAYAASKKVIRKTYLPQSISNGTSLFAPTTIVISLDGFRADFLQRGLTPNLNALIAEGVSPQYMLPSFPSVTFPNHFTLVTGLYPESHSVVGNTFWDPTMQEEFYYTDPARSMHPRFWLAEPIWTNAELHDIPTAIHMWPGSEAHIGSKEPTYLDNFNGKESLSNKVDRILSWLDIPGSDDDSFKASAPRPQLIAAYVPNVDADGHKYGPNSTEIRSTISAADDMIGRVVSGLEKRNLTHVVNLVVVSDHGMATTSTNRLIQLDKIIDMTQIEHTDGWPLFGLRPKAGVDLQSLYDILKKEAATSNGTFDVYLRDVDMPTRYHFSRNPRIAPLWIVPAAGWAIVTEQDFDIAFAKKEGRVYSPRGLHGYDFEHPLMRAIFVARGPAFPHPKGSRVAPFQNVEVYGLICDSLGLERKPSNGTLQLPLKVEGLHENIGHWKEESDLPVDDVPEAADVQYDEDGKEMSQEEADRKGWQLLQEMPHKSGEVTNLETMPTIVPDNDEMAGLGATTSAPSKTPLPTNPTKATNKTGAANGKDDGAERKQSWLDWIKDKANNLKEWISKPFKPHDTGAKDGPPDPYRGVPLKQSSRPSHGAV